mgnify:CR=1 FL=1
MCSAMLSVYMEHVYTVPAAATAVGAAGAGSVASGEEARAQTASDSSERINK